MDDKLISAFSKIINSDLLKSVYPMVDHIDIVSLEKNPFFQGYDMYINIYLNNPKINKFNMYKHNFDPHYLVDNHIQNLSKYMGIKLRSVRFQVHSVDGEILVDWS
jgi:hypothetical protein